MKKLEELGISPAPWKVVDSYRFPERGEWVSVIESANRKTVSVPKYNNGSLIAAAPKLYEALYDLIPIARNRMPSQPTLEEIEVLRNAEAALAEAAEESEARQ